RALRWRYLLAPAGRPGLHSLFGAVMIGFMSLNVLPLRLGEFIRAYVLARREEMTVSGVFATVVVERIFDGFTVLLFLLVSLFLLPWSLDQGTREWITAFSVLAVVIYLAAILFLVLLKWKVRLVLGVSDRVLRRLPRWRETAGRMILAFAGGLDALASLRLFAIIAVCSLLVWLAAAGFYWVVMFAFCCVGGTDLGAHAGYLGATFVLAGVALGVMLPSSPGFVGTFELACITAVAALGADRSLAESYALVSHAATYFPVTLTGIVYLYLHNFSLRQIQAAGEEARSEFEPSP
ncbi:MAG: lysylphosphatidylglycerol synthase transmembrane domain-containing protein, partial [Thermodesulfobacteriota bacterium]